MFFLLLNAFGVALPTNACTGQQATAVLALEPSQVLVPFLEDDGMPGVIALRLIIYNVSNLKQIHIEFGYNASIISHEACSINRVFYTTVGGWRGRCGKSLLDAEFPRPFSESAKMFVLFFTVRNLGTADIKLINVKLLDPDGNEIPVTIKNSQVTVVTLEEYVDGKYQELLGNYEILAANYTELKNEYNELTLNYNRVVEELNTWLTRYQELNSSYNELSTLYANLAVEYEDTLEELHECQCTLNVLNESYSNLTTAYSDLLVKYRDALRELDRCKYELNELNKSYTNAISELNKYVKLHADLRDAYMNLSEKYEGTLKELEAINKSYILMKRECEYLSTKLNSTLTELNELKSNYTQLKKEYVGVVEVFNKEQSKLKAYVTSTYILLITTAGLAVAAILIYFKKPK